MFGILIKNGEDQVKCKNCGGEGSFQIRGSLKVCKTCNGLGTVLVIEEAQRVLRQFQQPTNYTVSRSHSVVLRYSYAFDIIHALQALSVSGIKAKIIFPII